MFFSGVASGAAGVALDASGGNLSAGSVATNVGWTCGGATARERGAAAGVGVAASGGVHTGGDSAHRTEEENNARKKMGKSLMAN